MAALHSLSRKLETPVLTRVRHWHLYIGLPIVQAHLPQIDIYVQLKGRRKHSCRYLHINSLLAVLHVDPDFAQVPQGEVAHNIQSTLLCCGRLRLYIVLQKHWKGFPFEGAGTVCHIHHKWEPMWNSNVQKWPWIFIICEASWLCLLPKACQCFQINYPRVTVQGHDCNIYIKTTWGVAGPN